MTLISTVLWIVAIGMLWFALFFFLRKAQNSDLPSQRNMFLGMGLFMGFYGVTRVLFIIGWYLTYDEGSSLYEIYWRSATIVGMIGFTFLIFVLERYPLNNRTKHIATIASCAVLVVSIVLGSEIGNLVLAYSLPFIAIIILGIYLYLVIIGQGEIRKRSLENFLGILLILLGIMFDTNIAYNIISSVSPEFALIFQGVISPLLFIAGVIFFIYSNR